MGVEELIATVESAVSALHSMPMADRLVVVMLAILASAMASLLVWLLIPNAFLALLPDLKPRQVAEPPKWYDGPKKYISGYLHNRYTGSRLRGIGWLPFKLLILLTALVAVLKTSKPILGWLSLHVGTTHLLIFVAVMLVMTLSLSYMFEAKRRLKLAKKPVSLYVFLRTFLVPSMLLLAFAGFDAVIAMAANLVN